MPVEERVKIMVRKDRIDIVLIKTEIRQRLNLTANKNSTVESDCIGVFHDWNPRTEEKVSVPKAHPLCRDVIGTEHREKGGDDRSLGFY